MAAPAHTTRTIPTGYPLKEGFRIYYAFAKNATVQIWEQVGKPLGYDGGEAIDTTTQWNTAYHTMRPQYLKKHDPITFTGPYDPDIHSALPSLINNEGSLTIYYPDGSYHDLYAFLQKVEFSDNKIGEMPTATFTIIVTNWDPVNNVEVDPVFTAATGT